MRKKGDHLITPKSQLLEVAALHPFKGPENIQEA